jgi:uncharacterized membrane protein YsdA (DUF1294 family)
MPLWFWKILGVYLLLINLIGFVLMGMDKRRAKRDAWRIPEKTLLLTALFGGSIGSILGMRKFRHKTKHAKFKLLVPVLMAVHLALLGYLFLA